MGNDLKFGGLIKTTKKILVVSDLHVGSNVAIMPDEVYIEPSDKQREQRIESNPLQKVIFKEWCDMIDTAGKVDACFYLGDGVEGSNRKGRGFELWTPNIHQQVSTAADLLSMIKTNKYFGVQGSYYHVGENTSSDLAVMESLSRCRTEFGTDLAVNVEESRFHLAHVISPTSSPVSRLTASNKEILAAEGNIDFYNVLNFFHRKQIPS